MFKTTIPMINRNFPELSFKDIMTSDSLKDKIAPKCAMKVIFSNKDNSVEYDWKDYSLGVFDGKFDRFNGYELLITSFELVEKKNNDENNFSIGKERVEWYGDEKTVKILAEADFYWIVNSKKYQEFKEKYQDGDILVYYNSSPSSWGSLCGRSGLALIRGSEVVHSYGMWMS